MTRSLRKRHLALWLVLGPIVIVVFVLAIIQRVPMPTQELPEEMSSSGDSLAPAATVTVKTEDGS